MRKIQIFLWVLLIFGLLANIAQAKPMDRTVLSKEIRETLSEANMYTTDMHKLLLGTIASESDFGSLNKQRGGPALGIGQMEPSTHNDIWSNYLSYKPQLRSKVINSMWFGVPKLTQLRYNRKYQILMYTVQYQRAHSVNKCLDHPKFKTKNDEIWYFAWLHKKVFNTAAGKSTTKRFFEKYHEYVYKKD